MFSPVPVCEACWIKEHAHWEPESVDDNGQILMRLTKVDMPQRVGNGTVESCSTCGNITVAGIVEFKDPLITEYPLGTHSLATVDYDDGGIDDGDEE